MKPRFLIAGGEYEVRGAELWMRATDAGRFHKFWPTVSPNNHGSPSDVLQWLLTMETRHVEREREELDARHRAINLTRQQFFAWRNQ